MLQRLFYAPLKYYILIQFLGGFLDPCPLGNPEVELSPWRDQIETGLQA